MDINRRDFLKKTGAGTTLLIGGSGLLQGTAFTANFSRFQERSDISFVGSGFRVPSGKYIIKQVLIGR